MALETAPLGFQLQTEAPTLAVITASFEIGISGQYYWYWTTEYNSTFDMESGAVAASAIVMPDPITEGIRIFRPDVINTSADKWRIYRGSVSTDNDEAFNNPFPEGFLVAEVDIGTTSYDDEGLPDYTVAYPMMLVVLQGLEIPLSRNGTPPIPSTGDVIEDSLVVNDVNNPSLIQYSFPGTMCSWPSLYIYNFNTKVKDKVIRIRRVGKIILVAMEEQLIRVNYLLRETDPEFDAGRAWEIISSNHGVTGFGALDLITPDSGEPQLAFVHRGGLFTTDGYNIQPLESDLDWSRLVSPGHRQNIVLRNVPHHYILQMFYTPPGETKNTKAMLFHYHSSQRKDNRLKATGPITVEAADAIYAYPEAWANPTLITLNKDGYVKLEDRGAPPLPMKLRTRQILISEDPADEAAAERVYLRHRGGSASATGLVNFRNQGPGGVYEDLPPVDVDMSFEGFSQIEIRNNIHSFQFEVETRVPVSYWTLSYEALEHG